MASAGTVPPETIQIAEQSLARCVRDEFFPAFYQKLLRTDPTIPPKFARTDFARQNKLLQHGLGLLLIFAKRQNPVLLERIAVRHGDKDVDVRPPLYPFFVESLVATVKEYDPHCTPAVEQAWRDALAPGIAYLSEHSARRGSRAGG